MANQLRGKRSGPDMGAPRERRQLADCGLGFRVGGFGKASGTPKAASSERLGMLGEEADHLREGS